MYALARWVARALVIKGLLARWRSKADGGSGSSSPRAGGGSAALAGSPPGSGSSGRGSSGAPASSPRTTSASASSERSEGGIEAQRSGDAGPDSPLELDAPDWKATATRTLKEIKDDRVTLAAAGMAYYFLLAVFPAIIAFVGILGLVNADTRGIERSIKTTVPGTTGDLLVEPIEKTRQTSEGASLVAAVSGIAIALWSASSGMVALQSGLNIAYDVGQDRKFIGKRLVAFVLVIATAALGGVPSPLFTFGDSAFFVVLGWVLTVVAVIVLFSFFYYLGPNREKPSWRWVSAGGLIGALLWIVASLAFGFYVQNFGKSGYAETYGTAAGVIVLILWLFLTSLAVLIGGELNAELERQGQEKTKSRG
jgi:membrane protein